MLDLNQSIKCFRFWQSFARNEICCCKFRNPHGGPTMMILAFFIVATMMLLLNSVLLCYQIHVDVRE